MTSDDAPVILALLGLVVAAVLGIVRRSPWWLCLLPGLAFFVAGVLGVGAAQRDPADTDPLPDFGPLLLVIFGGYLLISATAGLAVRGLAKRWSARRS